MKLFLFALLALGAVFGVCPNNCNSHGICQIDGSCICQKQSLAVGYEKIYGYGGSDCSLILCPVGYPFQMNSAETLDVSETPSPSRTRELSGSSAKSDENETESKAKKNEQSESGNTNTRLLKNEICTVSSGSDNKIVVSFSNEQTKDMIKSDRVSELTLPASCDSAPTNRRNLEGIDDFTSKLRVNAEIIIELKSDNNDNVVNPTKTKITAVGDKTITLKDQIAFKDLTEGNTAQLILTLTTYPEFTQVDSSTVYSVNYDFGISTLGRMMCKKSGEDDSTKNEVIISKTGVTSYVDYNGFTICPTPYNSCGEDEVYPLDLECDTIEEVKDMTFKEVLLTTTADGKGEVTLTGYSNIVPTAVIGKSLPALCYHTETNENGFLYKHTAELTIDSSNVKITVTQGTDAKAKIAANDVCIILSALNGKEISIDNNKDLKVQCDICSKFTILDGQLLMDNYKSDNCKVDGLVMTIGGSRTRLMINNYESTKGLLIPTKCEGNSEEMMNKIRKDAKVSITFEISGFKEISTTIISYEDNIMKLADESITFKDIPARMLDPVDGNQIRMIITLTQAPDFTPVSGSVYSVNYDFGAVVLGRMMCKVSGEDDKAKKEVIISKTGDTSYVDYNGFTICLTAYISCDAGKVYPLDLECDKIKEVEDMTFKEVLLTISADGNGKVTWNGYGNIVPTAVISGTKSAQCYNNDSSTDFGKLIGTTSVDITKSENNNDITITIATNGAKENNKYICYLNMKVNGAVVDLSSCENKDKFYKVEVESSDVYYIKDIYLNRVQRENDDESKTTTGSMKIQSIIDTYFNTSQYMLYIPTNDEGDKFKELVKVNNIIDIKLEDFSQTVQITDVDDSKSKIIDGYYYLLKITPPIISIKSKYEAIKNDEKIVLTNIISSNISCKAIDGSADPKKYICKHMFLSLNLGIEGGRVTVTKTCPSKTSATTIVGNVLAYKSPISYIEYDEDLNANKDCTYSDFKVSSKRSDLSLYHTSIVGDKKEVEWTGYADALKLMGFEDNDKITFKCLTSDGKKLEEKETTLSLEENPNNAVFTFTSGVEGEKCYTFIRGDKAYVNVKDSEASFLFNADGSGVKEEIEADKITVDSKPVKDDETSKIEQKVELQAGAKIASEIQKISEKGYIHSDGGDAETGTQRKLPVPLPEKNKEVLTNKIIPNEVVVTIRIIYDDNTIDIREALVTESKTTSDNKYMILTTEPQIDLSDIVKNRRRMRQLTANILSVSMLFASIPKAQSTSLTITGLDLNIEGGKLYCKTAKGEGVVDVTYYDKDNGEMIIIPTSIIEDGDDNTPQCNILFKRNDLSLYADSIVDGSKITWKGYAEGFNLAVSPAESIPFVCTQQSNELIEYTATYVATGKDVVFTFDQNAIPSEGSICFPASKASNASQKISIDKLDIKDSCSNTGNIWYYGTKDGNPINKTDKQGNPTISFTSDKTNEILEHFSNKKEIMLPKVSNDNITSLFLLKCEVGMILEYNLNGIIKDSSTISSVKRDNENIYIKTIKPFDLPEKIDNTRLRSLAPSTRGSVSFTIRQADTNKYLVECSGSGLCDRTTGKCNCFDGFTGDACQRLDCPNNCNGNGRCVPLSELLSNTELDDYVGYGNDDRIYGCLCDKRHRGYDCSLIECPSGEDPEGATNTGGDEMRDCSGRGICNYNTGICECFDGFSGEGCQTQTQMM